MEGHVTVTVLAVCLCDVTHIFFLTGVLKGDLYVFVYDRYLLMTKYED
jgi:hypothetical protein